MIDVEFAQIRVRRWAPCRFQRSAHFDERPNEAACLRLVSAVLIELDEEWQGDRIYLSCDTAGTPS